MRYPNYKYNPRVNQILAILEEKPASRFTDLMQNSGLKNGVVSHYLKMMERIGLIRKRRIKNQFWYFTSTFNESRDLLFIHLRKETSKRVLVFLLNNKSVTFSQILKHVKKSPPTISFVLSNLLELKLIGLAPGIYKKYYLYDRETTATALKQIDPSLFDTMKDRFADAFSYF